MVTLRKFPKSRIIIITIILLAAGLSCEFLSGGVIPTSPADQDTSPPATQAPIPEGWKLSTDSTGTCQVAAPPEWELGSDFFLAVEEPDPGPFEDMPGQYPPSGLALWGAGEGTPLPEGHYFQIRTSRVIDGQVCSVWRIKADTDFTDDEKSEMEQVGATLQEVQ
jgi:hypothetical protein